MDHTADQRLKDNYPGQKKRRGIFQRLRVRAFFVLGWIAAGIACLLLVVFVLQRYRKSSMSLLSGFKSDPKIFRAKIPEEVKIAQDLFRGKIPAVDQPVKPQNKTESLSPVAEKTVLSQKTDVPSEKSKLQKETEFIRPAETQTKIETTPLPAKAVLAQPAEASPEKSEPQKEAEVVRQAEVRPQPAKEDVAEKTEERIIHNEKWLLSQEPSSYTIQLMGVRKEALLFDFVARNQLLKKNEIAFYQSMFKSKPWFQLLYGVYVTKKDAQSAADNLPPKIRKSSPWIRRLSAVQKAIRSKISP